MTTRQAAHRARRVADGAMQKSFVLSADVVAKLEKMAELYGSQTKAVEAVVRGAWDAWFTPPER